MCGSYHLRVAHTAVVVEQWDLVRLGIGAVLHANEVDVVVEDARARDGVTRARGTPPDLVVFGAHLDVPAPEAVRLAAALSPKPRILVLLDVVTRDDLGAVFSAGADGALLRSVSGDELSDAVTRVLGGERVLSPAFVTVMAGMSTTSADEDGALTPKEREVLALLARGRSNRQMADEMFISAATVKTHLAHLYEKLGVRDRQQAIERALAEGLLE
jgi:DNA-binding NarL/FixJ family response regulator